MTPKIRETLYYVGTIIPAILGLAMIWGGIDAGVAANIGDIVAGILALVGATAPATAAVKVRQQRKDGTFDDVAPADAVVKNVQAVIDQAANAAAELDKVKNVITGAVNIVPGMGPLAQQLINMAVPEDIWRGP